MACAAPLSRLFLGVFAVVFVGTVIGPRCGQTIVVSASDEVFGLQTNNGSEQLPIDENSLFVAPFDSYLNYTPTTIAELNEFAHLFFNSNHTADLDNWRFSGSANKPQSRQNRELFISRLNQSRSVLGLTNSLYFDRFIGKLRRGECTTILTLGGSVTCGMTLVWEKDERAWPWLLQHFLNEMFPCQLRDDDAEEFVDGLLSFEKYQDHLIAVEPRSEPVLNKTDVSKHVVVMNRCVSATGSSYASYQFQRLVCDLTPKLDLVIMEFASNDLQDNHQLYTSKKSSGNSLADSSKKYIEFLVRKLTSLNVSSLFLQASFRLPRSPPNYGNAELVHLPVQQYLDVPTVSFPGVIGKDFDDHHTDPNSKYYVRRIFRDVHSHYSGRGHLMLAYTLLWNIQNDVYVHSSRQVQREVPLLSSEFCAIDGYDWAILTTKTTRRHSFTFENDTSGPTYDCSKDWFVSGENRNKYGLISTTPKSHCVFRYDDMKDVFALEVGFLRSYTSMGQFRITFLAPEEPDDLRFSAEDSIQMEVEFIECKSCRSYIFDGHWSDPSSQYYFDSVFIPEGTDRFVLDVLPSEFLNLEDPQIGDRGTKVKLLTIGFRTETQACQGVRYREFTSTPDDQLPYYMMYLPDDESPSTWEEQNPGTEWDVQRMVITLPSWSEVYSTLNGELVIQVAGMLLVASSILVGFACFLVKRYGGPIETTTPHPWKKDEKQMATKLGGEGFRARTVKVNQV
eukprot:TRINITY_DN9178_c0_g1_i3.p1 TRINITY_DN9178_c0_g1~~TRINITY_DN9178_c0_g1_i3.p1  ORF type:complete len:734 (-),score=156.66 TRINITY_DN9178_c0_g1_i3:25-2226(-)